MNTFDAWLVGCLNRFAEHSCRFDWIVVRLSDSELAKGAVIMFLAWWAVFQREEHDGGRKPYQVLSTMLIAASVAVVAARILAWALPFRERPLRGTLLAFHLPCAMDRGTLPGWSAFPSDHAVLFVALAVMILFLSRPLGSVALLYVGAVICLPRIYLGIHWPTDILAGALIGVGFAYLTRMPALRVLADRWTSKLYRDRPGPFFALLFLLSYQVATLFREVRLVLMVALRWAR